MRVYQSVTDLIGNTPLVALNRFAPGARVLAKQRKGSRGLEHDSFGGAIGPASAGRNDH